MKKHRPLILLVTVLATTFAAGCPTGFVTDAARTSLASFLTSVFATAVNETIGP